MAATARLTTDWIDVLPGAAALVEWRGNSVVAKGNAAFDQVLVADNWLDDDDLLGAACRRVISSGTAERALTIGIGEDFDQRSYSIDITPVGPQALVSFTDTTAIATATRLLRRQMIDDPLTGLPNRTGFVEALEARMEADQQPAVVAINLSHFSRVNDCIGPLGGDELIVTVARRLKSKLRDGDLLARTGGDEFAVIVSGVAEGADLCRVAERIGAALDQPFRLSDFELKVDCAIGCAGAGADDDAEQVIRHAQLALKLAKRTRRVECYRPAALQDAHRRFLVETELRHDLGSGALHLALQPLIDLGSNRICGFEALARWQHWRLGAVSPVEFIAVAEDSGLIAALDSQMMDCALATLAAWDERAGRTLDVGVAINLSAVELTNEDVSERVADALRRHGIQGQRLTVELTESAILADPAKAAEVLDRIKATGARIAMDDFGTGYSNLALLRRLPIDILKIDRSLIGDMPTDPDKAAIVRAILSLAQALGLRVTAEGVETAETARLLAILGCNVGQGYHFARPLEGDAAYEFALARGA
ncbi:Cyclic di-GMP phosphodiesterase Gmr [Sphingomonas antarctica]|uniref:putative bifunctional diguanylate cyclase/phosphodiesterase n=1 Tax=Sphingomonas antarctica TaxID=2040274 RepID=UPI0039ECD267